MALLNFKYAGVGARKTPKDILELMTGFAIELAKRGFLLRSGNCDGADAAFAEGANSINPKLVELHLPWKKYHNERIIDGNTIKVTGFKEEIREFSSQHHPNWEGCNKLVRALHARNATIILGEKLDDPVDFCICWTPDSSTFGGTGQAIRICDAFSIPIINLSSDSFAVEFEGALHEVVKLHKANKGK